MCGNSCGVHAKGQMRKCDKTAPRYTTTKRCRNVRVRGPAALKWPPRALLWARATSQAFVRANESCERVYSSIPRRYPRNLYAKYTAQSRMGPAAERVPQTVGMGIGIRTPPKAANARARAFFCVALMHQESTRRCGR